MFIAVVIIAFGALSSAAATEPSIQQEECDYDRANPSIDHARVFFSRLEYQCALNELQDILSAESLESHLRAQAYRLLSAVHYWIGYDEDEPTDVIRERVIDAGKAAFKTLPEWTGEFDIDDEDYLSWMREARGAAKEELAHERLLQQQAEQARRDSIALAEKRTTDSLASMREEVKTDPAHVIISGGGGTSGSISAIAMKGFDSTKFDGQGTVSGSIRVGNMTRKGGFCLDISLYNFSMEFKEFGLSFGSLECTWVVVTPGWGGIKRKPGGAAYFVGIIGLGIGSNSFSKGPLIREMEREAGAIITVTVKQNIVIALLPVKGEILVTRNLALGASFSGLLAGNASTTWTVNGERIPEFETFHPSNVQLLVTASLIF
jgi:hypothetical protein